MKMHITLGFIIVLFLVYLAGARWPMLAQKIGAA
jgi:hypothetical protein